jgi:O-antigen/teichoic acid export membrane protein
MANRTTKSIKNALVSIIYYTIGLIVGFWSRKIFYTYLGSEVLGLDTTANTLLGFLNLAELGIGTAIGFFLYEPMYQHDTLKMNEIVALQGWIYRRIAFVIVAASIILMCFFPYIFNKINIPSWYPYATFIVLLIGSLLGYFMNYRQCILEADQAGYKVTRVTQGANIGFKIILILILPYVSNPFLFYIGTTLLGSIFGCLWLNHILKTDYPWLHKVETSGKQLLKKYPDILKKTSQIFFHRITTTIVFQVAPLIMYAFTTLTQVAYYGNYLAILDKFKQILNSAFQSTGAGIGNLIASHDKQRIDEVFWELIDSRLCISTSCLIVLGLFTEPFISVWLSSKYLLGPAVLFLVTFNSWLFINRSTVDSYINGFGIFQDTWAPVVEGAINLMGAIALGYFFDIAGVLAGGVISTLIIIYGWKPYFLFTRGLKENPWKGYFLPMTLRWILIAVNVISFSFLNSKIKPNNLTTYKQVFCYFGFLGIIIIPFIYGEFYLFFPGMRHFHKRIYNLIWNFLKKKKHF